MQIVLGIVATLLFLTSALAVVRYLRSSFELLDLVKQNARLWTELGRPERHGMGEVDAGSTIQPALPWLRWVWRADTRGLDARLASKLQSTSSLFRTCLYMFVSTIAALLALMGSLS